MMTWNIFIWNTKGKPNPGFQGQEKEFQSNPGLQKGFQNMITFVGLSDFLFFFGVMHFFYGKIAQHENSSI